MFTFLKKLLGLSAKETVDKNYEDALAAMHKSAEAFQNRSIYKTLTPDIINNTPDDKLLQLVFDNLCEHLKDNQADEYDAVLKFDKPQQAIYIIWCFEAQVNNGGFNQFYFNSSKVFAHLTPDALQLVGAHQFAKLAEKANEIYLINRDEIEKFNDGTIESFSKSYEDELFDDCDDEFFKLYQTEPLEQIQITFIRKNIVSFTTG